MEKLFSKIEDNKFSETINSIENKKWNYLDFQFQYISKLEKGELPTENFRYNSFGDMLEAYTSISGMINTMYCNRVPKGEFNSDKYCEFQDLVTKRILDDHDKNENWSKNVKKILDEEINKIGPILPEDEMYLKENPKIGLTEYQRGISYQELNEFGFKENAEVLTLHFPSLFEQKLNDESINNLFSQNSLSLLASKIVDELPEVEVITGVSWIVDSPIGKKIGFQIYQREKEPSASMGFWGQFLDQNGDLKKEKVENFLKTGVPEYQIAHGFIKTEDFLKKYLPKEKRGLVLLKERTQEYDDFRKSMDSIRNKIFNFENKLSDKEIDEALEDNVYLKDYLPTEDGIEFAHLVHESVQRGIPIGDLEIEGKEEALEKLGVFFKKFSDNGFVNREVII